jgi:hypothetical protein
MMIKVTVSLFHFAACEQVVLGQKCSCTWYLVKTEASCSSKYQVWLATTHTLPALVVFATGANGTI